MENAKYSGGDPEWRVLRKARQEITFATYCGKSEAINNAFRYNFLDHNLNVISETVLQKFFEIFLEINIINFCTFSQEFKIPHKVKDTLNINGFRLLSKTAVNRYFSHI